MFNRFGVLVFGALILVGCVTGQVPEKAVKLNQTEIKSMFTGKTSYGSLANKSWDLTIPIIEYYAADMRVVYKDNKRALFGAWRVKDDLLCTRYVSQASDEEYCWEVYELDGKALVVHPMGSRKGKVQAEFITFKDGDTEGLID